MARIGIAALGTLGDVLPFVELGRGLAENGHDVTIATEARFAPLAAEAGLGFDALSGDPSDMFAAVGFNPEEISPWRIRSHLRLVHRALDALVGQSSAADLLTPWRGIEFVIFSPTTTFARFAAEELGVPSAMMALTPMVATGSFAHPVLTPFVNLGSAGNRASWLVGERLQRQTYTEPLRPATRTSWGLPSFPLAAPNGTARWPPFPVLHGFSGAILPRPADWPRHIELTGWLFPPGAGEPLPSEVEEFVDAGPLPLYIGFGSMPLPQPEATARLVSQALAVNHQRAIVSGDALQSASVLQQDPAVLTVPHVSHARLFERVAGVVHHGGSGTVGTGLRAGRPTLVIPTIFDQFFWGHRVASVGAGPPPLPFHRLTVDRLAASLRALSQEHIRAGAARIAAQAATEDGVGRAVAVIEGLVR